MLPDDLRPSAPPVAPPPMRFWLSWPVVMALKGAAREVAAPGTCSRSVMAVVETRTTLRRLKRLLSICLIVTWRVILMKFRKKLKMSAANVERFAPETCLSLLTGNMEVCGHLAGILRPHGATLVIGQFRRWLKILLQSTMSMGHLPSQ